MKVLILIISSDNDPVYAEHRKVWSSYMNSNPQIESYFIQYRDGPQAIEENTLWLTGTESYQNILPKTIDSLEYFLNKDNYDYIIRTNMSSLWNFDNLLKYLETLPKKMVYNGPFCEYNGVHYASGCGIIMSPDLARIIVDTRKISESVKIIDDVDIGFALNRVGVHYVASYKQDFYSKQMYDSWDFDNSVYHFKLKADIPTHRHEEVEIMWDLKKRIYS